MKDVGFAPHALKEPLVLSNSLPTERAIAFTFFPMAQDQIAEWKIE